jgi:hypothetical protein
VPTTVQVIPTSAQASSSSAESQATEVSAADATPINSSTGLSSAAKVGIGVGVTLAVVLLVAGGALEVYLKQSRAMAAHNSQDPFKDPSPGTYDELDFLGHGGKRVHPVGEKDGATASLQEVPRAYQAYRPGG